MTIKGRPHQQLDLINRQNTGLIYLDHKYAVDRAFHFMMSTAAARRAAVYFLSRETRSAILSKVVTDVMAYVDYVVLPPFGPKAPYNRILARQMSNLKSDFSTLLLPTPAQALKDFWRTHDIFLLLKQLKQEIVHKQLASERVTKEVGVLGFILTLENNEIRDVEAISTLSNGGNGYAGILLNFVVDSGDHRTCTMFVLPGNNFGTKCYTRNGWVLVPASETELQETIKVIIPKIGNNNNTNNNITNNNHIENKFNINIFLN